jgi:hypothetical protein
MRRRRIEAQFELVTGGQPMVPWMWTQHQAGKSLRQIATQLSGKVGHPVSHESVRTWMREG